MCVWQHKGRNDMQLSHKRYTNKEPVNRMIYRLLLCFGFHLAEREGFEPPVPHGTTVFKTAAIDHSAISPVLSRLITGAKIDHFFK